MNDPFDALRVAYEQGKHDCKSTHAIRGLQDINRIAARGYDDGQRDALAAARRIVAGFLNIDETGDRRCADPTCELCVVAPLIYAALEDLTPGDDSALGARRTLNQGRAAPTGRMTTSTLPPEETK